MTVFSIFPMIFNSTKSEDEVPSHKFPSEQISFSHRRISNQATPLYEFFQFPKVYQQQKIYRPNCEIDIHGQHIKYEIFYYLNWLQKQPIAPLYSHLDQVSHRIFRNAIC